MLAGEVRWSSDGGKDNTMIDLVAEGQALLPALQELRRDLHAHPEVGLDLPRTQETVLTALEGLPLEITTGVETTSVVAVLRGTGPGRPEEGAQAVLLRGDMDALAVEERTDEPFRSENGNMHACGHDLHTAGLVGAARLLSAYRDELDGDVVFMFQPGEEGFNGASVMIREGVLDAAGVRVSAAYGVHVLVRENGMVATKPGTLQAGSNVLTVTVHGEGGHGSQPHNATDPVPAIGEMIGALQTMVTRTFDVFDPVVMSITRLQCRGTWSTSSPQAPRWARPCGPCPTIPSPGSVRRRPGSRTASPPRTAAPPRSCSRSSTRSP